MNNRLKLSAIAMMGGALFLSGCASTGMPYQQANYQLPQAVNGGYWAMTTGIGGEAAVVSFNNGMSYNYRFKCYVDGTYEQVGVEKYKLMPSANGVGLQYGNEPIFSQIKVVQLQPKRSLTLNQTFNKADLQQAYPNGQQFTYVYKPNLEPNCSV